MFSVAKEIHFCYGHRLLHYEGKCRFFHGHNGKVVIELRADTLDTRGMVWDFGEIKKALQTWIDDSLDHRMILHQDDPMRKTLETAGEPLYILPHNPTAENIARAIFQEAQKKRITRFFCDFMGNTEFICNVQPVKINFSYDRFPTNFICTFKLLSGYPAGKGGKGLA